jgi:hypothetical protein
VEADPDFAPAWSNLSAALGSETHRVREEGLRAALISEALETGRRAAELGEDRYNLACALALNGQASEALHELADCLERNETTRAQIRDDPDWGALRGHPEFRRLLEDSAD